MDTSPTALFDSYEQDFQQLTDSIKGKLEGAKDERTGEYLAPLNLSLPLNVCLIKQSREETGLRRAEMDLEEADEMVRSATCHRVLICRVPPFEGLSNGDWNSRHTTIIKNPISNAPSDGKGWIVTVQETLQRHPWITRSFRPSSRCWATHFRWTLRSYEWSDTTVIRYCALGGWY